MKTYRIAVVGGDGIGPEVIASTVDVLAAALRGSAGLALWPVSTRQTRTPVADEGRPGRVTC